MDSAAASSSEAGRTPLPHQRRPASTSPSVDLASDVHGSVVDMKEIIDDDADDDVMFEDDDDDDDKMNRNVKELPPHHCRYCTLHDPLAVVRCTACKKWFCNSSLCTRGSHIINHLTRAKHNEISLHEDSPLGDGPLECYVCGARNVFMLGFISCKDESVVVLICREPCLQHHTLKDMQWDPEGWQPLIHDRQLLTWLVKRPAGADVERCRHLTNGQIKALEEMWRTRDGDLDDLNANIAREQLPEVPYHFKDGHEFRALMQALIDAECEANREQKEHIQHENIAVTWKTGLGGKQIAAMSLPLIDAKYSEGDAVLLLHKESKWETQGVILRINSGANTNDEVEVETKGGEATTLTSGFTVQFVFKSTAFDRMRTAMTAMATEETSLSAYLYHSLLGHPAERTRINVRIPKHLDVDGLASLNESQQAAITSALQSPLSLIQGPPGTGKTTTSASLVFHMAQLNNAQVLVAAPSNVAVDQLAERIAATGLNVVRVAAVSREGIATSIDRLMLHVQVRQFCQDSPERSELRKLHKLKEVAGDLRPSDRARYLKLIHKVEEDLIGAADVVCCTCSGAGDKRLSSIRFKHVLIDESTQASEPETLIPMVMGAKQVVLVGDHCQLGPTIISTKADAAGLGRSMFERLVYLGFKPHRLQVQYRMHPCLSEFSSNHFYDGTLQNGVAEEDRDAAEVFPWPNPRKPMFFYNSIGAEEVAGNGTSFLNRAEAALAERMVSRLMQSGVTPDQIGVITPYEGQRAYIVNYFQRSGTMPSELYLHVEVASVDSFQGREKEFTILTCVRSNNNQGIGFLSDWRRLNVALTRARKGVIVIGNARVLSQNKLWHDLLTHFKKHSLVVDGPPSDLRPVHIVLQKPREAAGRMYGPMPGGSAMFAGMLPPQFTSVGSATAADTSAQSETASVTSSFMMPAMNDTPYELDAAPASQPGSRWGPVSQSSVSSVSNGQ